MGLRTRSMVRAVLVHWQDTMRAQRTTLHAQEVAAEKYAIMADEQIEVARMERERLAGVTWRTALAIAGKRVTGSPVDGDLETARAVEAELLTQAQWFAHHLGTPEVF